MSNDSLEFVMYGTNNGPFHFEVNGKETDFAHFRAALKKARSVAPDLVVSRREDQIPPQVMLKWQQEGRVAVSNDERSRRQRQKDQDRRELKALLSEIETVAGTDEPKAKSPKAAAGAK